jgi:hypothetical protein
VKFINVIIIIEVTKKAIINKKKKRKSWKFITPKDRRFPGSVKDILIILVSF